MRVKYFMVKFCTEVRNKYQLQYFQQYFIYTVSAIASFLAIARSTVVCSYRVFLCEKVA
jgi:hypothetical protein